jgi:hypothetical protein
MRFHPAIAKSRNYWKRKTSAGLSSQSAGRQYLPGLAPWEDYRQGYSARKSLGGGVILDGINELDYITLAAGRNRGVFCFAGRLSSLELIRRHGGDSAQLQFRVIAEVHWTMFSALRPLQPAYRRRGDDNVDINEKG